MQRRDFLMLAAGVPLLAQTRQGAAAEIPADVLEDKIRGGFLGQVIGDLNGLKHEIVISMMGMLRVRNSAEVRTSAMTLAISPGDSSAIVRGLIRSS